MVTVLVTAISTYLIITLTPIRLYHIFPLYSSKHPQAVGFTIALVGVLGGIAFLLSTIATSHSLLSEVIVQVLLGSVSGVLASFWLRRPTFTNARLILISSLIIVGAGPSYWRDTLETLGIKHIGPLTLEYKSVHPSGLFSLSQLGSPAANGSTLSRSPDPGQFGFARLDVLLEHSMEWDRNFLTDPLTMPLALDSDQHERITEDVKELEDVLKAIYAPFSKCYKHIRKEMSGSYRADNIALELVNYVSSFLKRSGTPPGSHKQQARTSYALGPPHSGFGIAYGNKGRLFRASLSDRIEELVNLGAKSAENTAKCKNEYLSAPGNDELVRLLELSKLYPYTAITLALIRAELGLEKTALQELLSWEEDFSAGNEYLRQSPFGDIMLVRLFNLATLIADKANLQERFKVRLRFIGAAEELTDRIRVLGGIGVHGTCREGPRHSNTAVYVMTRLIAQNTFADAVAEGNLWTHAKQADIYSKDVYEFDVYDCFDQSAYSREQLAYYRASFLDTRAKVVVFVGLEDYMHDRLSRVAKKRVLNEAKRLWTDTLKELQGINRSDVGQNYDLFFLVEELRDKARKKLSRLRSLSGSGGW